MQKVIILIGLAIVLIGVLYPYLRKLPFGQLPGDIFYKSDNFSFIFPIVTCIIISIILTVIWNLFR
jgi:formate hydrogenlyase subunit 3/multisubunit Na+/H+ antiporter MnhD subunit